LKNCFFLLLWQNNYIAYSARHKSFILTGDQISITLIKTGSQVVKTKQNGGKSLLKVTFHFYSSFYL
jgi:hypothetical protein